MKLDVEIGNNRTTGSRYLNLDGYAVNFDTFSTEPGPFGPAMLVLFLNNTPVALIGAAPDDPEKHPCPYPNSWLKKWYRDDLDVIGNSLCVWPLTFFIKESGLFSPQEIATALDNQDGKVFFDLDGHHVLTCMKKVTP